MNKTKIKCDVLAIDLSSLIFRSYYALPSSIKDEKGNPVNGIKGYLDTLNRLKNIYKPKIIVHAIDTDWRPKWRYKLIPEYKSNRVTSDNDEEIDLDLVRQIESLPEILNILGMQCIGKKNYEADDVLASIAKAHSNSIVVTGDKDLFQVIDDKRKVLVHLLGKDGGFLYNEKELQKKYGIRAHSYLDFAVLKGDPSDGLPGLKGIGEKTALSIIKKFETVENLIESYSKSKSLSENQKKTISSSLKYILNAKKVVKLNSKLDIKLNMQKVVNQNETLELLKKYRIDKQINNFFINN